MPQITCRHLWPRAYGYSGNQPGCKRAEGVAETPEPLDAERPRSPGWIGRIRDCREQAGIDHGCADPQ